MEVNLALAHDPTTAMDPLLEALDCPIDQPPRIWAFSDSCPSLQHLMAAHSLTRQQALVAQLLVARRNNAEIAVLLKISPHTAKRHVEAVLLRVGVRSRWDVESVICRVTRPNEPDEAR